MPSQVVDDLWHEFILFTRDYARFCRQSFGQFLHHTPAVKLSAARADNEGLRRVWWYCCLEENINPRKPTRLPLLFALDRKLGIANGFVYDLHCGREPKEVMIDGYVGSQCVSHLADPAFDGATTGFGCSSGGSSHAGHAAHGHQGHVGHGHSGHDVHGGHGDHGIGGHDGGDSGCSGGCSGGCGGD